MPHSKVTSSARPEASGSPDLSAALQRVIEERRSVRSYLPDPPLREDILELVRLATLAPGSCNLQMYEFVYVDDPTLLGQLKGVATGKLGWAPACFVVLYDPSYGVARNAALQGLAASVQNLLLGATARGLGTCWMAGFVNDEEVKRILRIPPRFELTGLITIGYPQPESPRPYRRPVEQVLSFNGYDAKGRIDFPKTTNVDRWTVPEVVEYRRRIAPVYAPRFHLASFSDDVTRSLCDLLDELIADSPGEHRVLDVASYDGAFARALEERRNLGRRLTVSDYFDYPLENLASVLPEVGRAAINPRHQFAGLAEGSQDLVTCVNKLECIPLPGALLKTLFGVIRPGGRLFLTTMLPYCPSALKKRLDVSVAGANFYEKNQLYRLGPFRFRHPMAVRSLIRSAGFVVEQTGVRLPPRDRRSTELRRSLRPSRSSWRNLLGGQWLFWCVARKAP